MKLISLAALTHSSQSYGYTRHSSATGNSVMNETLEVPDLKTAHIYVASDKK